MEQPTHNSIKKKFFISNRNEPSEKQKLREESKKIKDDLKKELDSIKKQKKELGNDRLKTTLAILGISKHESKFQKEEIDYEAFLELTEDDLKEMSLPIGVIIKIQKFQKEQNDMMKNWALNQKDVQYLTDIQISKTLAFGNFGRVYEGIWQGTTKVALKQLHSRQDIEEFTKEIDLLKKLRHPNVVTFFGVFDKSSSEFFMVTELLPLGNLKDFLKANAAQLLLRDQLHVAQNACAGLCYLAANGIVHRDIAARNLLVKQEDFKYFVKVSDFGLSRSLGASGYYVAHQRNFPIKWTSPESIEHNKWTVASDIWSFGITLWEIFARGEDPFPGMKNSKAKQKILEGYQMESPPNTPNDIFELMKLCWNKIPSKRPSFSDIYNILDDLESSLNSSGELSTTRERNFTFRKPEFLLEFWKKKALERQKELLLNSNEDVSDNTTEVFGVNEDDGTEVEALDQQTVNHIDSYARTPSQVPANEMKPLKNPSKMKFRATINQESVIINEGTEKEKKKKREKKEKDASEEKKETQELSEREEKGKPLEPEKKEKKPRRQKKASDKEEEKKKETQELSEKEEKKEPLELPEKKEKKPRRQEKEKKSDSSDKDEKKEKHNDSSDKEEKKVVSEEKNHSEKEEKKELKKGKEKEETEKNAKREKRQKSKEKIEDLKKIKVNKRKKETSIETLDDTQDKIEHVKKIPEGTEENNVFLEDNEETEEWNDQKIRQIELQLMRHEESSNSSLDEDSIYAHEE